MPDMTPTVLRELYQVPPHLVGSNSTNRQAIAMFLDEHFSPSDLRTFQRTFEVKPSKPVATVIGPNDPLQPTGEASLDVQTILGIAPNVSTWVWSVAGRRDNTQGASEGNQEPFLKWIMDMNALDDAPYVHSVSYDDDELSTPRAFMERMDVEFIKAGLLGRTLLFAAGDDGARGLLLLGVVVGVGCSRRVNI